MQEYHNSHVMASRYTKAVAMKQCHMPHCMSGFRPRSPKTSLMSDDDDETLFKIGY